LCATANANNTRPQSGKFWYELQNLALVSENGSPADSGGKIMFVSSEGLFSLLHVVPFKDLDRNFTGMDNKTEPWIKIKF
jgi:hypothetical protein